MYLALRVQSKPRIRALASALGAVLLFSFLSEWTLRDILGLGHPVLISPDPACDYTLKPDQNLTRFFAHTHTNRFGMRSDDVPALKSPQTLRLMFVGDSLTYGTSRIDQSKIFTELLHQELPSILHKPVEVLNASAGGWAIENEVSYVESRGTFQSDAVVMVLNDDDLTQPRTAFDQYALDVPQDSVSSAVGELYVRFIRPHFTHGNLPPSAEYPRAADVEARNLDDLAAFASFLTTQRARLILVFLPFRCDIPMGSAAAETRFHNWAALHAVPFVDLTSAEAAYPTNAVTLDGAHLNAQGNRVVADALKRQLLQTLGLR